MRKYDTRSITDRERATLDALRVFVYAKATRIWLTDNDPMALRQARRAIDQYTPDGLLELEATSEHI